MVPLALPILFCFSERISNSRFPKRLFALPLWLFFCNTQPRRLQLEFKVVSQTDQNFIWPDCVPERSISRIYSNVQEILICINPLHSIETDTEKLFWMQKCRGGKPTMYFMHRLYGILTPKVRWKLLEGIILLCHLQKQLVFDSNTCLNIYGILFPSNQSFSQNEI